MTKSKIKPHLQPSPLQLPRGGEKGEGVERVESEEKYKVQSRI